MLETLPGQLYVIEGCVSTTATYGDAFRVLTLYRLEACELGGTLFTVSAQIVFVRRINSFIRALIHRAADGGMRSNFAAVLATLSQQAEVTDGSEARPATQFPAKELLGRDSAGEAAGHVPAQPAGQSAPQPSLPTAGEGRMAALLRRLSASRMLTDASAAADALADRCRLDAETLRGMAVLLAWAVCFKFLAMLCRSDVIAAVAVAGMFCASQRQRKPIQVSSRQAIWRPCSIATAHALAALRDVLWIHRPAYLCTQAGPLR